MRALLAALLVLLACGVGAFDDLNDERTMHHISEILGEEIDPVESDSSVPQLDVAYSLKSNPTPPSRDTTPLVVPRKLRAAAGDNGVNKPWLFFATNYTLTLSWIAFCIFVVISGFLGSVAGWFIRKSCAERRSKAEEGV